MSLKGSYAGYLADNFSQGSNKWLENFYWRGC